MALLHEVRLMPSPAVTCLMTDAHCEVRARMRGSLALDVDTQCELL